MKKILVFILFYLAVIHPHSGVSAQTNSRIGGFELLQNYPNPFFETTNIKFNLEKDCFVKLFVKKGTAVQPLVEGEMSSGSHGIIYKNNPEKTPGPGKIVCVLEVYSGISGELIHYSEINMEQK